MVKTSFKASANAPAMDHFDLGIANFKADEVIAKLKARNLKLEAGGTQESFKFLGSRWFPGSIERAGLRRACRPVTDGPWNIAGQSPRAVKLPAHAPETS
jgi:hypothetical protein